MATDWVALVNMALSKIGAANVTTASLAAGTTKQDRLCLQLYANLRDRLQGKYTWNFCKKATRLNRTDLYDTVGQYSDAVTITNITTANPIVVTAVNEYTDGQTIYISEVSGMDELNDLVFEVASANTSTFALSGVDGGKFSAYTSGGKAVRCEVLSSYFYGYTYDIPSDCLRLIALDSGAKYEILESRLVTTDDAAVLIYVKNVTDTTLFSDLYEECLEDLLAATLAVPLLGAKEGSIVRRTYEAIYRQSLAEAKLKECTEINKGYEYTDPWETARR